MTFDVAFVGDAGYVYLTLSGAITDTELKAARGEANAELDAHGCRRLLVDATAITRMQPIVDDFEFTTEHNKTLPPGTRHAVVIRSEHREHMQFVEDVAQNRGIDLRLFMDRSRAIDWLVEPDRIG